MSTRCLIGLETVKGGEVKAVYCHSDGYIKGGVGEMLLTNYADVAKIAALIDGGGISALGAEIGPVLSNKGDGSGNGATVEGRRKAALGGDITFFYTRDGGENASHNTAQRYTDMAAFARRQANEYPYIYCHSEGEWQVYNKKTATWERVADSLE